MIFEQARSAGWIARILLLHVPPAGMSVCPVGPVRTPNIDGNKKQILNSVLNSVLVTPLTKQINRTEEFVSSPNSAKQLEVLVGAASGLCKQPASNNQRRMQPMATARDGTGTVTNISYLLE